MKSEDYNRLKSLCEENGFELLTESPESNDKYFVVKKAKDIWEGVEFAESTYSDKIISVGKIYKILHIEEKLIRIVSDFSEDVSTYKHHLKPSTEQAYIEQLKKECFERFGEIKEGDRFEAEWITKDSEFDSDNEDDFCKTSDSNKWVYIKSTDRLFLGSMGGAPIYCQGKWAKRVPKRVKVTYAGSGIRPNPTKNNFDVHEVRFYVSQTNGLPKSKAFDFLSSQYEKYLNGEIE